MNYESQSDMLKREQAEARKRPLLDNDRIATAHAEWAKEKAETAKKANKYGYSGRLKIN